MASSDLCFPLTKLTECDFQSWVLKVKVVFSLPYLGLPNLGDASCHAVRKLKQPSGLSA